MDQPAASPGSTPHLYAVVVLYRRSAADSVTVQTLTRALQMPDAPRCSVLLYDNTPPAERHAAPAPAPCFQYHGAEGNRGILGAVEAALARAEREGCNWLLTLDQDTALPPDFFPALQAGIAAAERDQSIGVIVPHLAEQGRLLSPAYVGIGRARPLPRDFAGVPRREARAFNSAALLRVAALRSITAFDPCFWLDHFDSWLHHQLYQRGWRMHVLGAPTVEHQLSLLDYAGRVSAARYRNFLGAEAAYTDLYQSRAAALAYTAQLAVRWLNQVRRRQDREIRAATRRELWRRITMRKQARISAWRASVSSQLAAVPAAAVQ